MNTQIHVVAMENELDCSYAFQHPSMGIDPMPVHTTLKGIAAVFHPKKLLLI